MENYVFAVVIATIGPGLFMKSCNTLMEGVWYAGKRMIYGRQKTTQEVVQEIFQKQLEKMEKNFEERILEISNHEKNIDMKLDKILKINYYQHGTDDARKKE